jgi:O-antigen/teichoic acid export membrane protein
MIQLINFVTAILAARLLGPNTRGQLAIVLLYPQLISNLGLLGLDKGISLATGKKTILHSIWPIIGLCFILSLGSFSIFYPIAHYQIRDAGIFNLSLVYAAYMPFFFIFMLIMSSFQGSGNFADYNAGRLTFYITYVLLLIIFWMFNHAGLSGFVVANLCAVMIAAVYSLIIYLKRYGYAASRFQSPFPDIAILVRNSWMFIVPVLITVAASQIDQIIISKNMNSSILGLYVVYLAYSRLSGAVSNAFNVHMFHASIQDTSNSMSLNIMRMGGIYFIISIILMIAAKPAITLLYGAQYLVEYKSLYLIVIASFINLLSQIISEYFRGKQIVRIEIFAGALYLLILSIPYSIALTQRNLLTFSGILICAEVARFLCYGLAFRRQMILTVQ